MPATDRQATTDTPTDTVVDTAVDVTDASAADPAQQPLPAIGPAIATGVYRHYKGGRYQVLGLVRHSESLQVMVLYRALYGEHGLWVRPREMFDEQVLVDGVAVARFAPLADSDPDGADAAQQSAPV